MESYRLQRKEVEKEYGLAKRSCRNLSQQYSNGHSQPLEEVESKRTVCIRYVAQRCRFQRSQVHTQYYCFKESFNSDKSASNR